MLLRRRRFFAVAIAAVALPVLGSIHNPINATVTRNQQGKYTLKAEWVDSDNNTHPVVVGDVVCDPTGRLATLTKFQSKNHKYPCIGVRFHDNGFNILYGANDFSEFTTA